MNRVPVDLDTFMTNVDQAVAIDPVTDYETGAQSTNRDGVPKWKLVLMYQEPGRKRELVEVGFAATRAPSTGEGAELKIHGLFATYWSNNIGGNARSGLSLSAENVEFVKAKAGAVA